ncbi:MAG: electron transfer flavoprotein subunit alpha/FixB family protein [Candidatus Poseidoniales archaeon]|jgi:electron transfer flavoprotein alpha subunit|nr:electron transfer flavoprotein subunit alpha/FixB family protein [Candidatus Poseidoniales archaeon]
MSFTIIAETNGDSLHPTTYQLISAASNVGEKSIVICPNGEAASEASKIEGVEKVISVVGDCFDIFDGSAWSAALNSVCEGKILISASPNGREIGARIAAKRNIPIIQDIVSMSEGLTVTRPIYSGKAIETLTISGDAVITLRPNAFEAAALGNEAPINIVNQSADIKIAIQEAINKASERLDVTEADIIISGGRGMGSIDNFSHLENIADIVGAAVGASRAVVDEWGMPHRMQVGQTGKTVTPSLYIAVGISGAIQHLAGMRSSKYILAINKDPDAPIFGVADYGIVSTWEEAIPALESALSELKS